MGSSSHRSRTRSLGRSSPYLATRPAHAAWVSPVVSDCRRSGRGISSPSGPSGRTKPRSSKPLADSVQDPPGRGRKVRCEPVERPDSALGHVDETGLAKLGHVMRNGRLRYVEARREVADADRLLGVTEAQRDLESRRVREGLQDLGRLFDLLGTGLQRRRAADAALPVGQDHQLFHEMSLADPLTNVNGFASVPSTLVYASEVPV